LLRYDKGTEQPLLKSVNAMSQTYRAILNGSQVTWLDVAPELSESTEVEVVLVAASARSSVNERGARMAQALQGLADRNTFGAIDPLQWQQEVRHDRPLPGRDR
jgi:hypothetical protein